MPAVSKTIFFSILLAIALGSFMLTAQTFATVPGSFTNSLNVTAKQAGIEQTAGTPETIATRLGTVINYLAGVLGVIMLTIILVGGYLWMTAGGAEEKVQKAKGFIVNGISGMLVIFLGYALIYVILFALDQAANSTK